MAAVKRISIRDWLLRTRPFLVYVPVIIGIMALIIALVGFIPLLGWLNWLVIPGAVVGLVLGLLSKKTSGRNINIVVLALAIIRLALGGGIL